MRSGTGAFVRAIGQADEILSKTAEFYSALDAKGLAICGLLALCARDDGRQTADDGLSSSGRWSIVPSRQQAIEPSKKPQGATCGGGKSVLRLFDELVKCDEDGMLNGVREVVEGK